MRTQGYEIDFHTLSLPIIVCGCSRLRDVFLRDGNSSSNFTLTLYVVKRSCDEVVAPISNALVSNALVSNASVSNASVLNASVSKQSTFKSEAAWQPSVRQTQRGMAALLSSLFVLSQMVRKYGIESENKLLAVLYSFTCFPPAVRTR